MANNCWYCMHVKGKRENVEEFYKVMTDYNHTPHFWRVFSADIDFIEEEDEEGNVVAEIAGDCAWSVCSCMCEGTWSDAEEHPEVSSSLEKESKRLDLAIEVFSEEEGFGFQEHYFWINGKKIVDKVKDWEVFFFDEDKYDKPTREKKFADFLKECGLENEGYTIDDLDGECLYKGGFYNYCIFSF